MQALNCACMCLDIASPARHGPADDGCNLILKP